MHNAARQAFNSSFTKEKYNSLVEDIEKEFPTFLDFKVAESPVFIDRKLKSKLLIAANGIIDRIKKADFKIKTERAIPEEFKFSGESKYPHFIALDFGICADSVGDLEPQLIEMQGFPSLFAYQSYLSGKYIKFFEILTGFSSYFNRLNAFSYVQRMGDLINPSGLKQTILLDVYPKKQKTRLDFALSKTYWNIETVCLSNIYKNGHSLFYKTDKGEVKIDRIYNRLIFDEVEAKYPNLKDKIDLLKSVDIEWLSHPNWFYRLSKYSLPLLKGPYIPESHYLSEIEELPEDLNNYVLKPFFSFAGKGVNLHLNRKLLDDIADKENYLLQRKVDYIPCIEDIRGEKIKTEIRLLYIWPEGNESPILMTNLTRLSRGEMIGVDHNKNFDWVGGSSAFFESN